MLLQDILMYCCHFGWYTDWRSHSTFSFAEVCLWLHIVSSRSVIVFNYGSLKNRGNDWQTIADLFVLLFCYFCIWGFSQYMFQQVWFSFPWAVILQKRMEAERCRFLTKKEFTLLRCRNRSHLANLTHRMLLKSVYLMLLEMTESKN